MHTNIYMCICFLSNLIFKSTLVLWGWGQSSQTICMSALNEMVIKHCFDSCPLHYFRGVGEIWHLLETQRNESPRNQTAKIHGKENFRSSWFGPWGQSGILKRDLNLWSSNQGSSLLTYLLCGFPAKMEVSWRWWLFCFGSLVPRMVPGTP